MRVLHDAIRPPLGFELEHLVVTTFTLDLVSLLSVPLAFTWFGSHGDTDAAAREPLELLAAVARSAQRITVFHQGGQVTVPAKHGGLLPSGGGLGRRSARFARAGTLSSEAVGGRLHR